MKSFSPIWIERWLSDRTVNHDVFLVHFLKYDILEPASSICPKVGFEPRHHDVAGARCLPAPGLDLFCQQNLVIPQLDPRKLAVFTRDFLLAVRPGHYYDCSAFLQLEDPELQLTMVRGQAISVASR